MIGDDDFDSFFDPDDFGCVVQMIEPGKPPRQMSGLLGAPAVRGGVFRAGIDPGAAQVRAAPNQVQLQIAAKDTPRPHLGVKIIIDQAVYLVADVKPIGRLRALLTMTPDGTRTAPAKELGKWQVSS